MTKKISFKNLHITISETLGDVTYAFSGDVDETFRQQDVPRIAKPLIIFQLEGINNFNSCGIREWIQMINDIRRGGDIVFRRCSVTMIDQINMVPDSLGGGTIESFFAPYYCSCGGEVNKLVDTHLHASDIMSRTAPEFPCEQCQQPLEFDALEESYFLFANNGMGQAS